MYQEKELGTSLQADTLPAAHGQQSPPYLTMFLNSSLSDFSGWRWNISGSSCPSSSELRNSTAALMKLVALRHCGEGEGSRWKGGGSEADLVTSGRVWFPGHEWVVIEHHWLSGREVHVVPWPRHIACLLIPRVQFTQTFIQRFGI